MSDYADLIPLAALTVGVVWLGLRIERVGKVRDVRRVPRLWLERVRAFKRGAGR